MMTVAADDKLNLAKLFGLSVKGWKTWWENEKILVTRIFSFSPQCIQKTFHQGSLKLGIV